MTLSNSAADGAAERHEDDSVEDAEEAPAEIHEELDARR